MPRSIVPLEARDLRGARKKNIPSGGIVLSFPGGSCTRNCFA